MFTVGIDVGGTKFAYGLFDEQGALVEKFRRPSNANLSAPEFFDEILLDIGALLKHKGISLAELRGVGIGLPSFVEYEKGYILKTSALTNLHDFYARDYLEKRLGGNIEVRLDNDAHVAALAEHRKGAGQGFQNMLYCPVSTGISSALIIDGRIFRGSYGFAGESGHQIITPGKGIACGCGNRGCLMSYASGGMIVRHVCEWIAQGQKTKILSLALEPSQITVEHIAQAYDQGDEMARRAIAQMADYMAIWLFNLYVTLNINCYVFGGGLLHLGERLFPEIRRQFDAYKNDDYHVYFKAAALGEDFGIIGAAQLFE